jgi:hypothetical protein
MFCAACGLSFYQGAAPSQPTTPAAAVPPTSHATRLLLSALAVMGGFVVLCAFGLAISKVETRRDTAAKIAATTPEPASTAKESSPADKLRVAKEMSSTPAATADQLSEARRLLAEIPTNAPEFKEAKKLIPELDRKINAKQKTAMRDVRETVIAKLEKDLLSKGMDFYFSFEGKNQDTLRAKYVLMSRPMVYQITNETDFLKNMELIGVKKVIFTDGFDSSWTYDLDK